MPEFTKRACVRSRSCRRGLRQIDAGAEAGYSLVEVLVAILTSLLILAPVMLVLTGSAKEGTSVITRAESVAAAESGLHQMDQELRGAYEVEFPTSTSSTGCSSETNGVQTCNVVDVIARSQTGTDYEVRYDCTVASTTDAGDRACWRYDCTASASTSSSSSCISSTSGVQASLVIDDLQNGTTASPTFSFCYPNTASTSVGCANGATRPTSIAVTVKVPSSGTLTSTLGGDPSTIVLTDGVYMSNLDFNQ